MMENGIPQGLKPLFQGAAEKAKPEGLAYPRSDGNDTSKLREGLAP
jgi:hypothetical protein